MASHRISRRWLGFLKAEHRAARRRRQRLPLLEPLEPYTLLSTYVVTNTNTSGAGSFNYAVEEVNGDGNDSGDTIDFNIDSGPQSVPWTVGFDYSQFTVDATTQPGYDGTPLITMVADSYDPTYFSSTGTVDITFRGMIFSSAYLDCEGFTLQDCDLTGTYGPGVDIYGPGKNLLEGDYIGTDATGTSSTGTSYGVEIIDGSSGNTIGGTATGEGNLISGNADYGVYIEDSDDNVVEGNLIGIGRSGSGTNPVEGNGRSAGAAPAAPSEPPTSAPGTAPGSSGPLVIPLATIGNGSGALPNGGGVYIGDASTGNTIGGDTSGSGNVISGNDGDGVVIDDASDNVVEGDLIGTNSGGTAALPNTVSGVVLQDGASDNTIGGTSSEDLDVISGNGEDGVDLTGTDTDDNLVEGDYIGTDITGIMVVGNSANGVLIQDGASDNTIGGTSAADLDVISGNGGDGIQVTDPTTADNLMEEVYVGSDVTGMNGLGNGGSGFDFLNGSADNSIGGTITGGGNEVASDANFTPGAASNLNTPAALPAEIDIDNGVDGIDMPGDMGTIITRAFIGVNLAEVPAPNMLYGISMNSGAKNNIIGSTIAGNGNLISGNAQGGIQISGAGTSGNLVEGNFIGTNLAGTGPIRETGDGIDIAGGASNNSIGASVARAGNLISRNQGTGISISGTNTDSNTVQSNFIGTDVTGNKALPNLADGVDISASASDNTIGGAVVAGDGPSVRNIIAGNGGNGVAISDASDNDVQGNYIGMDVNGATRLPNGGDGVLIGGDSSGNDIGGTTTLGLGNLISANAGFGVEIDGARSTSVEGNLIGTDPFGSIPFGNAQGGVAVDDGASGNSIGGTDTGAGNLISGNGGDGVGIGGGNTSGNTVEANQIGTNTNSTIAVPNVIGVEVFGGAMGNTIGGTAAGAGNVIAGNTGDGVAVDGGAYANAVEGNLIGFVTVAGNSAAPLPDAVGVEVSGLANGNTIGGTESGAGNVISGNIGDGVAVDSGAFGNAIEGNLIGVVALTGNGTGALPNVIGVEVFGQAAGNTIGGTATGAANVISRNANDGIDIHDPGTTGNKVEGNFIGTDISGTSGFVGMAGGFQT